MLLQYLGLVGATGPDSGSRCEYHSPLAESGEQAGRQAHIVHVVRSRCVCVHTPALPSSPPPRSIPCHEAALQISIAAALKVPEHTGLVIEVGSKFGGSARNSACSGTKGVVLLAVPVAPTAPTLPEERMPIRLVE